MCLTIPKKVVAMSEDLITVENPEGDRQEVRTIVKLKIGDYVLTQQRIVVQVIDQEYAQEILEIYKGEKPNG